MTPSQKPNSVDDYIAQFPTDVQQQLQELRSTIRKTAPDAEELMSYGIPAYKQYGMIAYFAGYKNHVGFYATPNTNKAFTKALAAYKQGKGSVQFPLNKPLPLKLVSQMVAFNVNEKTLKHTAKKKTK